MISLLVSYAAIQVARSKPVWIVAPFEGPPSDGGYRIVSDAVAQRLRQSARIDVPDNRWRFGSPTPGELGRAVEKALDAPDATILRGRVFGIRLHDGRSGTSGPVSMKMIAYDAVSGLRVSESTVRAESPGRNALGSTIVEETLKTAASRAAQATQASLLPSATILNTTEDLPLINRGSRDGYRKNTPVVVVRGRLVVGVAHVGAIEPDQAELVFDRAPLDFSPGDHVRPILPPRG